MMMEDGNLISANPTHLDWEEMFQPGLLAGPAHGRIDATGDVIRVSLAGRISDDTFRQQVKHELAVYIGADVDKVKGYDFTGDGMPEVFDPAAGYDDDADDDANDDGYGAANHSDAELESRGFLTNYANESEATEDDLRVALRPMDQDGFAEELGRKTLVLYKGKREIGSIEWSYDDEGDATIEWATISKKHQGKGLGKVLYAEAGERMRRDGLKKVYGVIVDAKDRPVYIREIVFGNVESVKFNSDGDEVVVSKLRRKLSQGIANGKMDKVKARQAAEKIFGREIIAAMVDSGMLTFADSVREADPTLSPFEAAEMGNAQGWAMDGKAVIIARTITSESELKAIILHEVGMHLGFGNDIQVVSDFFDDMAEAAMNGNPIAKRAVLQATWAMLQDSRYGDAVLKLGNKFSRFIGMNFREFADLDQDRAAGEGDGITDAELDELLNLVFEPVENGTELDGYDRKAFANTLMEEVGAYVHNARAAAIDSDLAQSLWAKFLGFIRRNLYRLSNGRIKMGAFTDADIEAMAMSAIKKQAERGEANTPRDPLMDPMETRRRFSVTPEEAQRTMDRPMAKNLKAPETMVGSNPNLTEQQKLAVVDAAKDLAPNPDDLGKAKAFENELGFLTVGPESDSKPIAPAGTRLPESELSRSESTHDGLPIVTTRGWQGAGATESNKGSTDGKAIPGSGTGLEESGNGMLHHLKHVNSISARLAAIEHGWKSLPASDKNKAPTQEQQLAAQSDALKERLIDLRENPISTIEMVRDRIAKNATHKIEIFANQKDKDDGRPSKVTLVIANEGLQLVLERRKLADGSEVWSTRTIMAIMGEESKDNNTAKKINEATPDQFLEVASRFGNNPNKLGKGMINGGVTPINRDRRYSVSPQPDPGSEPSVENEVGGDTQNPAPTSPPPLPPQPPAPVAPGAAPVNPEVSAWQRAWDIVTLRYFSGISVKAHQNARRFQGASIQAVADLIHNRPGSQGSSAPRSIPASIATARGKFTNRFRDIMAPLRDQLAGMDTAAREAFYESLTDMITGRRNMGTGLEGQAADNLKKLLAEMHAYRLAAGEELGEIQDYFPVVYNSDLITKNRAGFLADAERAYRIEMSSTMSGPELDAAAAAAALALYNTHVRGMGAQEFGSLFNRSTPGGRENSSKERAFGRQAQNIMRKWQSNDPFLVITRYIGGAVKSAELARRFGADGMGWEKYAKGMEAEGVPQEIIEEMYQLVTQAAGVSTPGLGKAGQGFMDFVALYTAATSLGKSFMSNLFEPIAMGVRTGSPIYALRAYGETWTRSLNEFLKDVPIARMLAQESFWQQYGEHIGTIHNSLEDAWMTTHSMELGMDNQNPRMRWLTNRVYKANLMDATETAKQQASHALGHSYIGDLCKMISGSHWMNAFGMDASRSARQDLIELGVPESEHQAFIAWMDALKAAKPQQRMTMMTDGSPMSKLYEEVQVRFTNQSAVRANRAHRPVFQDNLMGKMFLQLQSFSYSYAAEANSRIYDNLKRSAASGDYTMADRMRLIAPAMMLPMAVAAFAAMFKLRRELYPTEAMMKHDNDPWWAKFADAASYAGIFGPKVEQAMKFVMRDQPPGGIVGQHAINAARAVKGYATAAIGPDEKYDKAMASANKAAVKAVIPPAKGALVAAAAARSPLLGTAASMLANDTTLSNAAIEATQPEPPDKKRELKNPYNYRQPRREPGK
jgi:GNAT superfamily N-acetyltransferase